MNSINAILRFPSVMTAPMAGITDVAFQKILFEEGAPFITTEMHSATAILRSPRHALHRMRPDPSIHPLGIQLFGNDPFYLSEAAKIAVDMGYDTVDLNMGCPARKIVQAGSGIALMKDLPLAVRIIRAVRKAVGIPLSVKLRLGLSPDEPRAGEFARAAEAEGADFIILHGRYRSTYALPADWESIAAVRPLVTVPLVGNGDIFTPRDARKMMEMTGCDAVMVGRCIMGRPWLPRMIEKYLAHGSIPESITLEYRLERMLKHLDLQCRYLGKRLGPIVFRKHAAAYLKGLPGASTLRHNLDRFDSVEKYADFARQYLQDLRETPAV